MQLVFSFTHCKQLVAQNYGDTDDPQIGRAFYVTKVASVDKDYILFLNHWFSSQKIYEKMLLMLWLLLFIIFFKVYFPSNKLKQFQTAFKHFKVQLLKSILFTLVTTPITHKKWVWVCGKESGEERVREEERLLQLPLVFCLRDFLGQVEADTIKPKKLKKQLFISKHL